jgi:lipopolysaccharide transport system ATP-binding protein
MAAVAIRVEALGKRYRLGQREPYLAVRDVLSQAVRGSLRALTAAALGGRPRVGGAPTHVWALRDVSLEVTAGEVVGIIGRNGAGKSTLLKILSRITSPTVGGGEIRGRVGSMLEVGTGFHPELTGRENIFLNGTILGMRRAEIRRRFDEIVDFADIGPFLDTPVKRYSSGMYMRLAFAVAAHMEPEILLVDEVLAVGDLEFQKRCLGKMGEVGREGRTVLLVSHNMASINNLCTRAILLAKGQIAVDGPVSEVVEAYIASAGASNAEVVWPDPNVAPGNEKVRVNAVRLVDPDGVVTDEHDIEKDITVQIKWWNLVPGQRTYAALNLWHQLGTVVLGSNNAPSVSVRPDECWNRPLPIGQFETVCRIPGNLLNEGMFSIDAIIGTNVSTTQVLLERVLSFRVYDSGAMRKEYQGGWHGVVRVRLDWRTRHVDAEGSRGRNGVLSTGEDSLVRDAQ